MVSEKIKILISGSCMWRFGEGMFGPLFAVFAQRVGGSILDITWAWAVFLLVTGILVMIVGKVADTKRKREVLMVCGYALNALFTFTYLLVRTPAHLLMVQAGLGIAVALTGPTWAALYASHGDQKQKCYEWGLVDGISQIIMAAGIILGGLIVTYVSFTALFATMGIIQVIATIHQLKILKK